MITVGIDIGSMSAKCVILEEEKGLSNIISSVVMDTGWDSEVSAQNVLAAAIKPLNFTQSNLDYIVSTGYGRVNVKIANAFITEISCHAKGIAWYFPEARTILDIGGQDCKVIACNHGKVSDFIMNDKCAAGTGRYLERSANVLDVPLDKMGPLSMEGISTPEHINSYCTVFAEHDIIRLLRQQKRKCDIMAGVHDAVVKRLFPLLTRIGMTEEFAVSGGVAKNIGIVKRIEAIWGVNAKVAPDPQIIGALGAAFFGIERMKKRHSAV